MTQQIIHRDRLIAIYVHRAQSAYSRYKQEVRNYLDHTWVGDTGAFTMVGTMDPLTKAREEFEKAMMNLSEAQSMTDEELLAKVTG